VNIEKHSGWENMWS